MIRRIAKQLSETYKDSRDTRITANVPLLNLNLNYEKLRHKDSKFYLLNNIYDANFCIL